MSEETQVSRYRALRGKSVSESRKVIDEVLEEVLDESKQDQHKEPGSLLRRSAFGTRVLKRRSKTLSQIDTSDIQELTAHFPVPPVPQVPLSPREYSITSRPRAAVKPASAIFAGTGQRLGQSDRLQPPRSTPPPPFTFPVATAVTTDTVTDGSFDADWERGELEEQKQGLDEEEAARLADRLEAETDRILAEQKKLDLARLHQELLATQPTVSPVTTPTKPKSPVLEKLNFFNRGRSSKAATLSPTSSTTASVDFSRAHSLDPTLSPRAFFEPGGHCMLMTPPQSPVSGNHVPERCVTVRYRGLSVNLTVAADTSTVDMLFQASDSVTHTINTAASVIYECYAQLGLERRLRRYERIRDVLNSWDRDTQNSLLILPSSSADSDRDLDISSVPPTQTPTAGFILQLHHSSRPGKWNKRWITLSENGQMFSSKKAAPSPPSRDSQYLCHLSDYDIYTLMSKSASATDEAGAKSASSVIKNLKPPKKFVYAVKSQQKTMAHADTANFVHFFCTDDPAVANKFHAYVHAWRSWYMVKARRDAQRKRLMDAEKDRPPQITPVKHKLMKSVSHVKVPGQGHRIRVSVDETPYTIGEFQPLVDLQRFDKPIDEFGKDWIPDPRLSTILSLDAADTDANADGNATTSPTADADAATADVVTPAATPTVEETVMTGLWGMSAEAQHRLRKQAHRKASVADERQSGVTIAVSSPVLANTPAGSQTKPQPQQQQQHQQSRSEPSSPPKPEPKSWLPSASEHTARVKAEQERLERLYSPPRQQRPSTSSGIAHSQRHHHHQQYSPPYARGGGRQQVGCGGGGGGGSGKRAAYPPELNSSNNNGSPVSSRPRFLEVPDARGMPPPSPSAGLANSRPSTSGGERGRQHQQHQLRSRSGSVSSMRRGHGGIGAPPMGSLPPVPPMPPMPPHIRTGPREGCGGDSPGRPMARDVGRSLTGRHL